MTYRGAGHPRQSSKTCRSLRFVNYSDVLLIFGFAAVFLSRFAAKSLATAFWSFSASTRSRLAASVRTSLRLAVDR